MLKEGYDVVVLTEDRYAYPKIINEYVNNVLIEDALLVNELERQGLSAARFSWSDPTVDWRKVKAIVFRTTWDYFDRFDVFSIWFEQRRKDQLMFNHPDLMLWNMDKIYLNDLKTKGINVPPTVFIPKGSEKTLEEWVNELGEEEFVLKPNVSGAARLTFLMKRKEVAAFEEQFKSLIAEEGFLLQTFQKNILSQGEVSIVLIGGEFTHAVLKRGKGDDFRVQDDFGGTVHSYQPTELEIDFALKCYDALEIKPDYCRVDCIIDNDGNMALSELEMIEPELWFRRCPDAARKLAKVIAARLD